MFYASREGHEYYKYQPETRQNLPSTRWVRYIGDPDDSQISLYTDANY